MSPRKLTILILSLFIFFPLSSCSLEIKEVSRKEVGSMNTKSDVIIGFGSIGSGTNSAYSKKVGEYIKNSKLITKAYISYWGKEGEHTYYLISKHEDSIFKDLKLLLPAKSEPGFIGVSTKKGKKLSL